MFWTVLGEVLTPGLGAALSPMLIVAAIVLGSSPSGPRKGFTFSTGVFVIMAVIGMLVVLGADKAEVATVPSRSEGGHILGLAVGILLCGMAWLTYKNRPTNSEDSSSVKRLTSLDTLPDPRIFVMGMVLGLVNVKNIPLEISVGTNVVQTGAGVPLSLIGMLVFSAMACSTLVTPGVIVLAAPEKSTRILGHARKVLIANNTAIMIVLYLMLGTNLISKSLGPLFA